MDAKVDMKFVLFFMFGLSFWGYVELEWNAIGTGV